MVAKILNIFYINLTCDKNNNISKKPYSNDKLTLHFSSKNSIYLKPESQEEFYEIIHSLKNNTWL